MPITDEMIIVPRERSTISVEHLVYSILEQDEEAGVKYGPVKKLTDSTIDVSVSPKAESAQQWADGGTVEDVGILSTIDITLELTGVPPEVQRDWFGHRVDGNGVMIKNANDVAPYIAVGFRSELSNHKYAYKWVLKAKPKLFDEQDHTYEGGVPKLTTRKVSLSGVKRKHDGNWQVCVNEGQEGVPQAVITDWFKKVYEPKSAAPAQAEPEEGDVG